MQLNYELVANFVGNARPTNSVQNNKVGCHHQIVAVIIGLCAVLYIPIAVLHIVLKKKVTVHVIVSINKHNILALNLLSTCY